MKRPNQRQLNQIAGALFLFSALVWFVRDDIAIGSTNAAVGVLFLILSRSDS